LVRFVCPTAPEQASAAQPSTRSRLRSRSQRASRSSCPVQRSLCRSLRASELRSLAPSRNHAPFKWTVFRQSQSRGRQAKNDFGFDTFRTRAAKQTMSVRGGRADPLIVRGDVWKGPEQTLGHSTSNRPRGCNGGYDACHHVTYKQVTAVPA